MMDLEEKRTPSTRRQDETIIALAIIAQLRAVRADPGRAPAGDDRLAAADRAHAGPARHRPRLPERDGGALRLRLLRRAGPGAARQPRLLGAADPRRHPAARAVGQPGPETNVDQIGFSYNALAPNMVAGQGPGPRRPGRSCRFETFASTRIAAQPDAGAARATSRMCARSTWASSARERKAAKPRRTAGLNVMQALVRAQALTDSSTDNVVTASGDARRRALREPAQAARARRRARRRAHATTASTTSRASPTRSERASTSSASRSRRDGHRVATCRR